MRTKPRAKHSEQNQAGGLSGRLVERSFPGRFSGKAREYTCWGDGADLHHSPQVLEKIEGKP